MYFLLDITTNIEFIISASFLIVFLSNAISVAKLYLSQLSHTETRDIKRKATITVLIISVIYCVCNIGSLVVFSSETETFSL